MGSIGDCYDNGQSWSRSGLGCRSSCSTGNGGEHRLELANAIFEYLEMFHNRQRRHSSLGMLSPIEYELVTPTARPAIKQADHAKPRAHEEPPPNPGRFKV